MADYDKLYATTPNALGAPTPELVAVFDELAEAPLRVLDIGCGQGRDALYLACAGHIVVGVDIAASGIAAVTRAARAEGLAVTGEVADIRRFRPRGRFDILLIDRTLHMLPKSDRLTVLAGLLACLHGGGRLILADEPRNIAGFRRVVDTSPGQWSIDRQDRGYLFAHRGPPS